MKKVFTSLFLISVLLFLAAPVSATSVAIVKGGFYTSDLYDALTAEGLAVTEITSYNAASLSAYDSVITYGNTFTNMTYLTNYVSDGGTLITTPWFWWNYSPPTALRIFDHGVDAEHYTHSPGINVLDAADPLLAGITFPTDAFEMGRTTSNFVAGVHRVAEWADGYGFIGHMDYGAGSVVGINMQVITSDTWYQVINQPWATQLFVNAVNPANPVPEPTTMLLLGTGLIGLAGARRKMKS